MFFVLVDINETKNDFKVSTRVKPKIFIAYREFRIINF